MAKCLTASHVLSAESFQFTDWTNRTGHVFAFQTADLDPYRDPRLSSSRPDGVTVSGTRPDSQEASSPYSSSCGGDHFVEFPIALV